MKFELPVIWAFHGTTFTGKLELSGGRLILSSRRRTLAFLVGRVVALAIDRSAASRLRGLPVLSLLLPGGDMVHVASLGGAGSLHELAGVVASRT
jgi:hypothetical protein